ncbi:hypothetical protein AUP68_12244 [Ilyonectria robusta]
MATNTKSAVATGPSNIILFTVPLNDEKVTQLREVTSKLKDAKLREQFSRRANTVGYTRESMQLQPVSDGITMFIVMLEFPGTWKELESRLVAYKDDVFDSWWSAKWVPIVQLPSANGHGLGLPPAEEVLRWSKDEASMES